jgi:hypothetical protein
MSLNGTRSIGTKSQKSVQTEYWNGCLGEDNDDDDGKSSNRIIKYSGTL